MFVTINDWPALSNISGQSNKGYNACTHCLDKTDSTYLGNKIVYLGHRRFLPNRHHVRNKGKHFKGEADTRTKPTRPDGDVIYDMVKDLEVIFGKGPGSLSVPKDANHLARQVGGASAGSIFIDFEIFVANRKLTPCQ